MKEQTKFRIYVNILGIFLPPVAVYLLYGFGPDFLLNCALTIMGFIPGSIHQMCLDISYWNRRKKVRRGMYPGDRREWIFSKDAQNGGIGDEEVEKLRLTGRTKSEGKREEKRLKSKQKVQDDGVPY
ncbi:Putative proteolipid membrane potential modulator [Septoria linicola]|uniref:Proteolipid membrane potential modulator n=1 Tax=Septoria linicola TaxID=215465 RepID=A0A9Q9AXH8_9PEZI|nr:Putative proteolipid membrane potential modulator [Septoria linicola]